jgi:hypothetical protein
MIVIIRNVVEFEFSLIVGLSASKILRYGILNFYRGSLTAAPEGSSTEPRTVPAPALMV